VCVCVCVCERERERERETHGILIMEYKGPWLKLQVQRSVKK